jgi:hypothetical protein
MPDAGPVPCHAGCRASAMPCRASAMPCRASASPLVSLQPHHLACGYDKERSKSSIRLWDVAYEGSVRFTVRACARVCVQLRAFLCLCVGAHKGTHAHMAATATIRRCNVQRARARARHTTSKSRWIPSSATSPPQARHGMAWRWSGTAWHGTALARPRRPLLPRPRHATAWQCSRADGPREPCGCHAALTRLFPHAHVHMCTRARASSHAHTRTYTRALPNHASAE